MCAYQFGKRTKSKDGLRPECKNCRKLQRINNLEEYKLKDKIYRDKNKKKRIEQSKLYYLSNKDKKKEYDHQYYINNKNKIIDNHKKYNKEKRLKNKCFSLRQIVSGAINFALKRQNKSKNRQSCLNYLPYSIQELKNHLENHFEFWMSWKNYGTYKKDFWDDNNPETWTWQIDHIIPQSILPYSSMEDENFLKCWSLNNLRPLSSKKNLLEGVSKIRHIL